MPYVMELNMPSNVERFARLATLMGAKISGLSIDDAAKLPVETYKKLCKDLGMKQKLSDVGIIKDDLSAIVDNVANFAGSRMAQYKREDIANILNAAF
jgi:alcohol dehydrogenase class IV